MVGLTAEMAPYLLLGFLLAGITHAFFPKEWIKTHLGGNGFMQSFKASLFGVPLPVCSCGIIPLAKELKKTGASNAGVAAFLASTPQTGVDSIAATAGLMGWPFAIMRVVVAFFSGIFTGTLIGISEKRTGSHLNKMEPVKQSGIKPNRSIPKILHYSLIELPGDIRSSLTLGLLIAACISLFLPELSKFSNDGNIWISYMGVILLAVPLYVCSTGSIPIAIALITSGFSPGAALIFLIAGPATNIVTLVTMTEIIGWKNTGLYLFSVIGIAFFSAVLIDSSIVSMDIGAHMGHIHESGITWFQWICFSLLVFSIFYDFTFQTIRKVLKKRSSAHSTNINWNHYQLKVKGMGCKKCAAKITGIIEGMKNHKSIEIDLAEGIVRFEAEKMDSEFISEKLSDEGYTVTDAKEIVSQA